MRILFTCAYFSPEKAASIYLTDNLIEDLCKAGHSVDVYTPTPTRGISQEIRRYYKRNSVLHRYDNRLFVKRFPLYREGKNPVTRAFRYFLCNLYHLYFGLSKKYDLLFLDSTPPTQGLIGAAIKLLRGKPIVYNLQDIFPDSMVSTGLTARTSTLWKIGRIVEALTYKSADKIIVISEDFKRNILAKGVPEEKIEVVYNWVDEQAVVPVSREKNTLFDEFGLDRNKFYVVYAGNLGSAQNIDIILDAAERCRFCEDLFFLIFGTDEQAVPYLERAERSNSTNLRILPIQPYSRVSEVYSLGDVAIVSCKKGFGQIAMPSKTWSILSAGTAVLASFDSDTDMQRIIESNGLGIFTVAEDNKAFAGAIERLYRDRDECFRMGCRGREYVLNNLTRSIGTRKYMDIMQKFV